MNVDLFNLYGTCVGFDLIGKIKSAHLLEHGSCNSSFVFNNPTVVASASTYTLCAGSSTTLNATGASTYVWEPGTLSGSTQTLTPSSTTTYTVTGSNAMGCTDTKTVTIVVNPNPIMGVTPIHADCSGSGGFTFLPTSGTAPFDIQINPCPGFPYCTYTGVTSAGLTTTRVYAPGTYTITTTDANGCTHTSTATINSSTPIGINLITHQPLCCGGNGGFSFSGLNPSYYYTFTISPCPVGAPCTYVTNGISTSFFYPAGIYTITMTDSSGCSTSVVTTLSDPQPCLQATANLTSCTVCIKPTADALLHELLPTTNFGTLNPIRASQHTYGGPWAGTKGLFQFDLSSIPPGSIITNATITLKSCTNCAPGFNQHYDLGGGTGNWGVLRRVVTPWTEAGVTWNTA
ncbi:MAG: DNRLRE domain-containing protein, partial [Trichococcus flocculiformis]